MPLTLTLTDRVPEPEPEPYLTSNPTFLTLRLGLCHYTKVLTLSEQLIVTRPWLMHAPYPPPCIPDPGPHRNPTLAQTLTQSLTLISGQVAELAAQVAELKKVRVRDTGMNRGRG